MREHYRIINYWVPNAPISIKLWAAFKMSFKDKWCEIRGHKTKVIDGINWCSRCREVRDI